MKYLYLLTLVPMLSHAGFSKPQLLARFMWFNAWNVPDNTWCFGGEPVAQNNRVYMNCIDVDGSFMASWDENGFRPMARAMDEQMFSKPVSSVQGVTWYEFSEMSSVRAYTYGETLTKTEITNLGPMMRSIDSFFPLTRDSFFFKTKDEYPKLWIWKEGTISMLFDPKALYVFSPIIGANGEIVIKTRDEHLNESAPDRIWLYNNNEWKLIFEDTDANPTSPWKSFRHQLSVEGNKVLTIATDDQGEALIVIEDGKVEVIARAGKELKSFDHFNSRMRAGTIVIRGEDFEGHKAVYVKDHGPFRKLLLQGDIVHTDMGPGRVYYQERNAMFYGAPGLDEKGNVYIQATLTDPDYPSTLMGVGLVKFTKE